MQYKVILIVPIRSFSLVDGVLYESVAAWANTIPFLPAVVAGAVILNTVVFTLSTIK